MAWRAHGIRLEGPESRGKRASTCGAPSKQNSRLRHKIRLTRSRSSLVHFARRFRRYPTKPYLFVGDYDMKPLKKVFRRGTVFVEYLLLVTLVGIGVIVGLAAVRTALINELNDLAQAINAIN